MKERKKKVEQSCTDKHCPLHGSLKLHGRTFEGRITKKNPHRTVNVEWYWSHYVPKYERYLQKRSNVKAHNPDCIHAQIGDKVTITETRPISKTKTFVVVKVEQ